jgi:hypothetical protein
MARLSAAKGCAVLFATLPTMGVSAAEAVTLEALGIEGGHLVSLDMSPSEFAAAPT